MPSVVNKSERLIAIEEYRLAPLNPVDVPEAILKNDRIQELLEAGELELVTADKPVHKAEPRPIKSVAAKKAQTEE